MPSHTRPNPNSKPFNPKPQTQPHFKTPTPKTLNQVHARNKSVDPTINWSEVARAMGGFTGAGGWRAGRAVLAVLAVGRAGRAVLHSAVVGCRVVLNAAVWVLCRSINPSTTPAPQPPQPPQPLSPDQTLDCMGLMNRAARMAARQGRPAITEDDIYAAMENKAMEAYHVRTGGAPGAGRAHFRSIASFLWCITCFSSPAHPSPQPSTLTTPTPP